MTTTNPKTARPRNAAKRSFTWNIRTTEISFMRVDEAEASMDGSANDCSAISRIDAPRPKPGESKRKPPAER